MFLLVFVSNGFLIGWKQRENVKGKTFNARTEANADVNFQILGESNPAVERALENRPKK